ncbi:MAG: prolyl oligopeptidase family serine peptidase [Gemmataceae bacterium]|nr:prolyl oligopeptidase family serine peptidase [Gemmataceae bacterium]
MHRSDAGLVARRGAALALSLALLVLAGGPSLAQEDPRAKEIREVEKQLAELKAKLDALKAIDPTKGRQPLEVKHALAWRSVVRPQLSRDGKWFACALLPSEGKGEILARQAAGDKAHSFKEIEGLAGLEFSPDGAWLCYATSPRRTNPALGPPAPASPSAVLVNLASGARTEFEGATRFVFSGPEGNALALLKPPPAPPVVPGSTAPPAPRGRGSDLVLRDLASGKDLTLGNVAEFGFDKKGAKLVLVLDTAGKGGNGVQVRDMKTGVLSQLESGKASYSGLSWTEARDAFALHKSEEEKGKTEKKVTLLACTDLATLSPMDPSAAAGFPKDLAVGPGMAMLSDDRSTVFFRIHDPKKGGAPAEAPKGKGKGKGKAAPTPAEVAKAAAPPSEKPDLVIWHWNDSRLQSEQQKRAGMDGQKSFLCAFRPKDGKFVRLADEALPGVSLMPKQRYAVAMDGKPYERSGSLDGKRLADIHVIDVQTGERHAALKKMRNYSGSSPDGAKLLYYDEGEYHVYDIPTRKSRTITKGVGASFIDTEDDHPVDRPPTRALGWTKGSDAVLLSDGWDVWRVPVAEGTATNLTGNGKKDGIRYQGRVVLDPEEKGADLAQPQVFAMYGERTKKSGYRRIGPKGESEVLCWDDAAFGGLQKAKDADVFIHTRETTTAFPDVYVSDASLKSPRRLTTANPEQDKFKFCAGSMLVDYESKNGDKLQGALFLPADYEKGKKYPTIVYIYEKLSQGKNRYVMPRLTGGGFNASLYTSGGYAVFMPDIRYKLNDPGMSSVACVLPALDAAIATGVVDKDKVALHGHSWGGYQTAFLITQTNAFKAAVAGAPLTDLISMYSSIYWNVGIANGPIFESSQGRFTAGYWEMPEAYIRNSPVFHAKKVQTPLILLHNDKDGAVDFNQGIEYFNTLRRLDKPVVMLQYKGENHGLAKQANMKDYTARMREFFDHHLMGKEAPGWLKEGVPHLKMDDHLKTRTFKE